MSDQAWQRGYAQLVGYPPVPGLDPGIAPYVSVLRANGIDTFESCQGGEGHAYPDPTVRFHGNAYEGFRAFAVAMSNGLPVAELRQTYDVNDGRLEGPFWEMVFRETM